MRPRALVGSDTAPAAYVRLRDGRRFEALEYERGPRHITATGQFYCFRMVHSDEPPGYQEVRQYDSGIVRMSWALARRLVCPGADMNHVRSTLEPLAPPPIEYLAKAVKKIQSAERALSRSPKKFDKKSPTMLLFDAQFKAWNAAELLADAPPPDRSERAAFKRLLSSAQDTLARIRVAAGQVDDSPPALGWFDVDRLRWLSEQDKRFERFMRWESEWLVASPRRQLIIATTGCEQRLTYVRRMLRGEQ
jgi:hypothetical protein